MADSSSGNWVRDLASIGGLALAAPLAVLRLYEFWWDRGPRLSILCDLCSDEEIGNTITLLNASKIPANIHYFDLVWLRRGPFGKRLRIWSGYVRDESPLEGEVANITVPAHSQCSLHFSQQYHFGWGGGLEHDIYLRLWMIGRNRPRWFWVTGPNEKVQSWKGWKRLRSWWPR